jgi:dTDP-4-amino-4,6-dideoxygalactose transaminase
MSDNKIEMVDLLSQHKKLEKPILAAIKQVIDASAFIKGEEVGRFEKDLVEFLQVSHVIGCANGTDALQIALMALDLKPGDEVIVPAFTYVATAEVIALLGLIPVMVDVEEDTFNISLPGIARAITPRTKAIIPVHLFGQCSDMEPLMKLAEAHNLWVIEDNAQSLGADYIFLDLALRDLQSRNKIDLRDLQSRTTSKLASPSGLQIPKSTDSGSGKSVKAGTIGHIGCTSFFPTKNLGCMGDGGAVMTNIPAIAEKIRMIANHGQRKKYYHEVVGCNSRLDTLQAAILNVKLPHLTDYLDARKSAGAFYQKALKDFAYGTLPTALPSAPPTYNQFTLKIKDGLRDQLKEYLAQKGIPTMIYYPLPLYRQDAFSKYVPEEFSLPVTEKLCKSVLSLPIHTEMTNEILTHIADAVNSFRP